MGPRCHIPLEGRCWLLASLGFLAIGWVKGLNLTLLLAYLMLVLWGLNFLLAGRGLGRLQVRRWIARPVFAGEPFAVEIELHNPEATDRAGILLEDRGVRHQITHFQVQLAAGATVRVRRQLSVPARGGYDFEPVRLSDGLPFGLVRRVWAATAAEQVPVFPRLGQLDRGRLRHFLRQAAAGSGGTDQSRRPQPMLASDFHGLRPFRAGDSPRWIHWRTSARKGTLMVREFEQGWAENLLLVLEPWLPDDLTGEDGQARAAEPASGAARQLLEDAISLAATLCWEWCRRPGDRLLLAIAGCQPIVVQGATGPELAERLLDCLAVQQGSAPSATDQLLDRLAEERLPAGPLLVISTRPDTPLPEMLARRFRRPVASLAGPRLSDADFYQRPRHSTRPAAKAMALDSSRRDPTAERGNAAARGCG